MKVPSEERALRVAAERLRELLDAPVTRESLNRRSNKRLLELGSRTFAIVWKASGATALVNAGVEQAKNLGHGHSTIPLVVVPYMGPTGQRLCRDAGTSWLDLSGNADIVAKGLRIHVEGRPNAYLQHGRPASVFAPKSSRIARCLLVHFDQPMTQRELARETGLGEGFTSRIVARLEELELIVRQPTGRIKPRDPDALLDAWAEAYDFSRHEIIRGHIPARSGEHAVRAMSTVFEESKTRYAFTGLSAAWLLTTFASFRIATVYLEEAPSTALMRKLTFRDDARGANIWLVLPKDGGVFQGAESHHGTMCVHPVQVWLDLEGQPERAAEAANNLRTTLWSPHAIEA